MQELRELARTPQINGFIADPPPIYSNGGVQGVNLEVDRYWLRCFRTEFGFWAEAAVPSFNYRIRKLLRDHRLDFSWKPPRWDEYCKSRGFDKDANPVTIVVLLSDIPGAGFLAEAPRTLNTYPIRYEARAPCVAHRALGCRPVIKSADPEFRRYNNRGYRPKARSVDSGSWIVSQASGVTGWDGMLFGGDGVQSYCCFAELIYNEVSVHLPNIVLP
jgi:hypothetical protein